MTVWCSKCGERRYYPRRDPRTVPRQHGGCGGSLRGWRWFHDRGLHVFDRQGVEVLADPDARQAVLFPEPAKAGGT